MLNACIKQWQENKYVKELCELVNRSGERVEFLCSKNK